MGTHGFYFEEDDAGFFYAKCACGWSGPPVLGITSAADCYGDHRVTEVQRFGYPRLGLTVEDVIHGHTLDEVE